MSGNNGKLSASIAALLMSLSSCSSLNIEVAVLNPIQAEAEADRIKVRDELPVVLAQDFNSDIDQLYNSHFSYYVKCTDYYIANSVDSAPVKRQRAEAVQNEFPAHWAASYNNIKETVGSIDDSIKTKLKVRDSISDKKAALQLPKIDGELSALLRSRKNVINEFAKVVALDTDGGPSACMSENIPKGNLTPGALPGSNTAVKESQKAAKEKVQELFESNDLMNSPLVYAVVSADEQMWGKKFDYSGAKGLFGNTDIAIKALGPGNFTIKGVSFNPADVAQMAAKVTTQSVLLAAQIAGVPVNISGSSAGTGSQLASTSAALAASQSKQDQRKIDQMEFDAALSAIAQGILDEQDQLVNAKERKQALEAINAIYQAQKSSLAKGGGS
jgi:hypothetical protein